GRRRVAAATRRAERSRPPGSRPGAVGSGRQAAGGRRDRPAPPSPGRAAVRTARREEMRCPACASAWPAARKPCRRRCPPRSALRRTSPGCWPATWRGPSPAWWRTTASTTAFPPRRPAADAPEDYRRLLLDKPPDQVGYCDLDALARHDP